MQVMSVPVVFVMFVFVPLSCMFFDVSLCHYVKADLALYAT